MTPSGIERDLPTCSAVPQLTAPTRTPLQRVPNKIPKHDIIRIKGDLNAKIVKKDVYQDVVAGRHTLRETRNGNGERGTEGTQLQITSCQIYVDILS
jgi:hypothetical protein